MISRSSLKDYIGILFYRHGLFCASNPFSLLLLVFAVLFLCCYPIANLSLFGSSLEQYKQPVSAFDGLEANAEINEYVQYERMADRPAWYNRVPIAYIQRIVIKSVFPVPLSVNGVFGDATESSGIRSHHKKTNSTDSPLPRNLHSQTTELDEQLYLIDLFRTSVGKLFELNELIRNFHTEQQPSAAEKSLVGDVCVHVGELSTGGKDSEKPAKRPLDSKKNSNNNNNNDPIKYYLPEFNCLYLSPANFWSNDFNAFMQDDNIMQTINDLPSFFPDDDSGSGSDQQQSSSKSAASFLSLFNNKPDKRSSMQKSLKQLRELLFGVAWPSTLSMLRKDPKLFAKLVNRNLTNTNVNHSKSVVFKYAITIALKKYDKQFIDQLKAKLVKKFAHENLNNYRAEAESRGLELPAGSVNEAYFEQELEDEQAAAFDPATTDGAENDMVINLQYTRRSFVYYIPYIILYLLLFLYIYISVRKIEFVKSKWGLAFAAVAQVIASLFMSIGICSFFGLTPTLNGGEIFPYLVIFIGFENIVVLTKSVVSTPYDLDVRYRIALGLKNESWLITKNLTFELIIIFFGILTMVPAIQEFCVFAYVGLLIDFFMQMIFFVTVLSIDIRRMELSDLNRQQFAASTTTGATSSAADRNRSRHLTNDLASQSKMEKMLLYKLSKKNSSKNFNALIEEEKAAMLRRSSAGNSVFTQNENHHDQNAATSSPRPSAESKLIYRGGAQQQHQQVASQQEPTPAITSDLRASSSSSRSSKAVNKSSAKPPTAAIFGKSYGTLVVNKSVQFFYFWARTRLVQRAVMLLTLLWIVLICYKSLLVVELMRHDVNVSRETVEALIPKGINLPKIVKENIQQFVFTSTAHNNNNNNNGLSSSGTGTGSTQPPITPSTTMFPPPPPKMPLVRDDVVSAHLRLGLMTTVDYLRRHLENLMRTGEASLANPDVPPNDHVKSALELVSLLYDDSARTTTHKINSNSRIEQDWQSLNYYHWLRLFANYNVSLYNRYVAILPQISLHRVIGKQDVLQYRNLNEIKHYRALPSLLDDFNNLSLNKCGDGCGDDGLAVDTLLGGGNRNHRNTIIGSATGSSQFSSALFELFIIVILGIPTIFTVVYLFTMLYKCLCSKKYEEWRRTWSTSYIKRQYKIMHSKSSRRASHRYGRGGHGQQHESDLDYDDLLGGGGGHTTSALSSDAASSSRSSSSSGSSSESDTNINDDVHMDEEQDGGSSEFSVKRLSKRARKSSGGGVDKDVILNKIFNGKKDEIELMPYNLFNVKAYDDDDDDDDEGEEECEKDRQRVAVESEEDVVFTKHRYPLDLISCGNFKFATSDINNQIIVWPLASSFGSTGGAYDDANSLARTIDLNRTASPPPVIGPLGDSSSAPAAVWSLCLSNDDRCLFVGQSDGLLKVFNLSAALASQASSASSQSLYKVFTHAQVSPTNSGITHLVEISQSVATTIDDHNNYLKGRQQLPLNKSMSSFEQSILLKNMPSGSDLSSNVVIKSPAESSRLPAPPLNPMLNQQHSLPLSSTASHQQRQIKTYLLLVVRINGYMELVRYTSIEIDFQNQSKALRSTESMTLTALASTSVASLSPPRFTNSYVLPPSSSSTPVPVTVPTSAVINPSYFTLMHSLRAHYSPITNLNYPPGASLVFLATQDNQLKLIKINNTTSSSYYGLVTAPSALISENAAATAASPQLQIRFASNEHGNARVTAICVDKDGYLNAATGSDDGLVCIWNLFTSDCVFKIKRNLKNAHKRRSVFRRMNRPSAGAEAFPSAETAAAIVRLEIARSLLISLSADHQLCIWNINTGHLVKEFKFVAPLLSSEETQLRSFAAASNLKPNDEQRSSLLGAMLGFLFAKSSGHSEASKGIHGDSRFLESMMQQPQHHPTAPLLPTMCLYSNSILITGGCSCIFVWNLVKGELIKKIYINKSLNKYMRRAKHHNMMDTGPTLPNSAAHDQPTRASSSRAGHASPSAVTSYSQMHVIKEIRLVKQQSTSRTLPLPPSKPSSLLYTASSSVSSNNKLLLVIDYTDTIYLIKLPEKLLRGVN